MQLTPMLAYVTVPDREIALALARSAVETGMAAGANISGPCHSIYRWKGEVKSAPEWQIFFQTSDFGKLASHLATRHPHLTPCIIGMKLDAGLPSFLDWIKSSGNSEC